MTFFCGKDAVIPGNKEIIQRFAYGSKSGQGTIVTDPRNQFISPFNAYLEAIIKKTEETVGKDLNITAASLKI